MDANQVATYPDTTPVGFVIVDANQAAIASNRDMAAAVFEE
jgi:hypothetical protein